MNSLTNLLAVCIFCAVILFLVFWGIAAQVATYRQCRLDGFSVFVCTSGNYRATK